MNARGGALIEALPALLALFTFVSGFLLGAYMIFARAWMQYQTEQALYCLSENRPAFLCRRKLEQKLTSALAWGRPEPARLTSSTQGKNEIWEADVRWRISKYQLHVHKRLDARRLVQSRALHW